MNVKVVFIVPPPGSSQRQLTALKVFEDLYPAITSAQPEYFSFSIKARNGSGIVLGQLKSLDHNEAADNGMVWEMVLYKKTQLEQTDKNNVYLEYRQHNNAKIHFVQDYLIEHLNEKITGENLATHVNMSLRNLTRVFKENTGITIWKYLTILRINSANRLLGDSSNTMDAIATKCGFKSRRQLNRILKK